MSKYIDLEDLYKYFSTEQKDVQGVLHKIENLPIYETLPTKPTDVLIVKVQNNSLSTQEAQQLLQTLDDALNVSQIIIVPTKDISISIKD